MEHYVTAIVTMVMKNRYYVTYSYDGNLYRDIKLPRMRKDIKLGDALQVPILITKPNKIAPTGIRKAVYRFYYIALFILLAYLAIKIALILWGIYGYINSSN